MKLEIKHNKKKKLDWVKCPRLEQNVDPYQLCHYCEWLTIYYGDIVKCRWTKEKEQFKTGERVYS